MKKLLLLLAVFLGGAVAGAAFTKPRVFQANIGLLVSDTRSDEAVIAAIQADLAPFANEGAVVWVQRVQ